MKKKQIVVLSLTLTGIFIVGAVIYYFLTNERGNFPTTETLHFLCTPKKEKKYGICYIENGEIVDVTDNEWLECGREVVVVVDLTFDDKNYILCVNKDILEGEFAKTPGAYHYANNTKSFSCDIPLPVKGRIWEKGIIPKREGKFTFLEFIAFPKNWGKNEKEFFEKIKEGKKILVIEKSIKCQPEAK